ncbi:hypothetical protein Tco_0474387 [Tanacetum coccineum]
MMNMKSNHIKGDMKVEAKSSSSGPCGKFIEVVIMLILIRSYYCFIHGYYCSTILMLLFIVTTAWYRLLLLVIFSAALHGWYYMVFVTTVGEEYDKVFNHLGMLNAPFEGKVLTCEKQVKPYVQDILLTAKSLFTVEVLSFYFLEFIICIVRHGGFEDVQDVHVLKLKTKLFIQQRKIVED